MNAEIKECEFKWSDKSGEVCGAYELGVDAVLCRDKPNCYYKQLQVAQKENEALKQDAKELKEELTDTEIKLNRVDFYSVGKENTQLKADLEVASEALKLSKYPCEDCRFYSDCDRKSKCRTKTNFVIEQALEKIGGHNGSD